jgi:hypothetical protein
MLDLNHPRTQVIFKASSYLGKLKELCRIFILQEFDERQIIFDEMKIVCNDFVNFSKVEFPKAIKSINNQVNKLLFEIDSLSKQNIKSQEGNCKVCDSKLHSFKVYVDSGPKITICQNCPNKLIKIIVELENITGVNWI